MSFSKVRPVLLAAGGNLLASHSAFFLSLSAATSAIADRQNPAATRVLMRFRKPCGKRSVFMVRLFMEDIFNQRRQWRQKDSSCLGTGQSELSLRVAGRGILAQIHPGQRPLRSESMLLGAFHSRVVLIGHVPEDHLPRVLGDQRFDQAPWSL